MKTLYKFLDSKGKKIVSHYDQSEWTIGEWRKVAKPTEICVGFNASELPQDSLYYVQGDVLAEVEVKGKIIKDSNKWTCEYMRIIKAWKWTKEDSVALAIYCAELCIHNWIAEYPNDDSPQKAIQAAKDYLDNPCKKTRDAAEDAAWAAGAARAARAAGAAGAAWAAWAAGDAEKQKIADWIIAHTADMEEIK